MNKDLKKVSVLLTFAILLISITPITQANVTPSSTGELIQLGKKVPLTDGEINAAWPNLPNAKELYSNEGGLVIDLRYSGKQASMNSDSLPPSNSHAIIDTASGIVNCTTSGIDLLNGGIIYNIPQIWLEYEQDVWIQVPSSYLSTESVTMQTDEDVTTWAIGMYNDPAEVAGIADVWGACTFGQFPANSFGTGSTYLCPDVLTVSSSNRVYQLALALNSTGKYLVMNVWSRSTWTMIGYYDVAVVASTGVLYNQYVRYSTSDGGSWQFWWNSAYIANVLGDTSTTMLKGDQANVVVESNDDTPSNFQGFSTTIGGTYYYQGQTYPLAATCFLFNGNWVPSLSGQYAPAGKVYMGGTQLGTWGFVGNEPPSPYWGGLNIGISSSSREIFTVAAGLPQPSHGTTLWTYGTV